MIQYDQETKQVRDVIFECYRAMADFHASYTQNDPPELLSKNFCKFDFAFLELERLCDYILQLEGVKE